VIPASLINSSDPGIRYWAMTALAAAPTEHAKEALAALQDASAPVRIAAASLLLMKDSHPSALALLQVELNSPQPEIALHAARALELAGEQARPVRLTMEQVLSSVRDKENSNPLYRFIRFSLEESLERFDVTEKY
jgi:hypothetical protein